MHPQYKIYNKAALLKSLSQKQQPGYSEIALSLESYDDIFSDFDSRDFSERALSDDFLSEAKKVSKEIDEKKTILKLLIPSAIANDTQENTITKRLHSYFKLQHRHLHFENKKIRKKGILLTILGGIMMVIASYISFSQPKEFGFHILRILFEPAGWFTVWGGLDHIFIRSEQRKSELNFFTKMSKVKIIFVHY